MTRAPAACRECGAPACPDPTGTFGPSFADRLCATCWQAHWQAFDQLRDEYAQLVGQGVHPRIASRLASQRSVRRRLA